MTFKESFLISNAKPNLEEVDLSAQAYKTISELKQMDEVSVAAGDFLIVCDNPAWLVKSKNEKGDTVYYSSDEVSGYVYLVPPKRKTMIRYILVENTLRLDNQMSLQFKDAEEIIDLTKKNNINIMEENSTMGTELDDILNQSAGEVGLGAEMTAFGDTPEPTKRKASDPAAKEKKEAEKDRFDAMRKKIREDVNAAIGNNDLDLSHMEALWKETAQFIAFITPTDKRQTLAAVKVPVKADERELLDETPADEKEKFLKNPASVHSQWIKVSYEIKARESKPGKPSGVILRVPACLKDFSVPDYIKELAIDKAKQASQAQDKATAIEIVTLGDFEQKLTFVGSMIKEAPETAPAEGKPGEIRIVYVHPNTNTTANKGVVQNSGMMFAKKIIKTGNGNKTPMHDKNYFPLTTYETVDITKSMPADVVADLNKFTFESLFTNAKNSKQLGNKHSNLVDSCKSRIERVGEDITSDYITTGSNRIDLTLTSFYDKNLTRDSINLPLKKRTTKADGSPGAAQFIKYNVTLEDKMADPDYVAKSALGNGKFQHIIDLVGVDMLTPAALKEKFKRSSSSSSSMSKYITPDTAKHIIMVKVRGQGLESYNIAGFDFNT